MLYLKQEAARELAAFGVPSQATQAYAAKAGNAAKYNAKMRIIPRHIELAVRNDDELNFVCYKLYFCARILLCDLMMQMHRLSIAQISAF